MKYYLWKMKKRENRALMANILVTGGAGYIGSHTVKELIKCGYHPIVLDNLSEGHKQAISGVELIEEDLADIEALRFVFGKFPISAVIHFAACCYVGESVQNPQKYYINNLVNGLNLLRVMLESGVNKLVFSSSAAIFGNPVRVPIKEGDLKQPINPYGRSKLFFEQILSDYDQAYDLRSISLRYFNAAGADPECTIGEDHRPETHLLPLILQVAMGKTGKLQVFGNDYDTHDGTCIRDYIHVTDLASAHILALQYLLSMNKSGVFNLGNGNGYSVKEVIETAGKICGKNITADSAPRRAGDPAVLIADSEKAKRELGWNPQFFKLEQIVETAWRWHTGNPNGY